MGVLVMNRIRMGSVMNSDPVKSELPDLDSGGRSPD
jgi:hypothetical protein